MLLKWNIWTLTPWSLSLLNPDASKISKFVAGSPEGKFLPLAQENINPLTPPLTRTHTHTHHHHHHRSTKRTHVRRCSNRSFTTALISESEHNFSYLKFTKWPILLWADFCSSRECREVNIQATDRRRKTAWVTLVAHRWAKVFTICGTNAVFYLITHRFDWTNHLRHGNNDGITSLHRDETKNEIMFFQMKWKKKDGLIKNTSAAAVLHLLCGQIHCHPASYMSRKCASHLQSFF